MLSKPPTARFIPPQPAREAQPYSAAYTFCGGEPAKGYWRQSCSEGTMAVPNNGAVQLPQNATILGYEQSGGTSYVRYQVCRSVFVQTAPPGPITCTSYPEQKARPASPRVPGRFEYASVFAWDAGARSDAELDGDLVMKLTMSRVVGVVVGLCTDRDRLEDPAAILHGLYFHQSAGGLMQVCAIESGARVSEVRAYSAEDVWQVRRVGGVVEYVCNGDRFYRSLHLSEGPLLVGCAMFATGDVIE
ncbi:hypothetical protein [Stenotrophomonas maltophilia]|uniref:hypothetical protein n=1 Tax=Stenotrophomonas maltophilia TaxID=40324 RepID=UPI001FA72380|nr:hypothetical protein [Stenotrophomonas maltophilia]